MTHGQVTDPATTETATTAKPPIPIPTPARVPKPARECF
jgi:hypothetical protein